MKNILKSTAILGGSSAVSIIGGLITAKVNALELGPSGVGLFALLQSLLGIAGIIAGVGLSSALVRFGAEALAERDFEGLRGLWYAAWWIYWVVAVPAAVLVFVLRAPLASIVTGDPNESGAVGWIAIAVALSVAAGLHTSFINAHHRVSLLARLGAMAAIGNTALIVIIILVMGRGGIPFAILGGALWSLLVARWLVVRQLPPLSRKGAKRAHSLVRPLAAFGGPVALSSLAGTGVQMALPLLVLAQFDQASVGHVRAAWAITVTYVGFLLAAMGQDYYPRLSAVSQDNDQLNSMVNRQLEVILVVALPMILLTMVAAPAAIPLLYSSEFTPAVEILQWQLVGDVFKFTSWALAFTILARGSGSAYLITETAGGVLLLGSILIAMRVFGVAGFGIGYALAYVMYCVLVLVVVRRSTGFRFEGSNAVWIGLGAVGLLVARVLVVVGGAAVSILLTAGFAMLVLRSYRRIRQVWNTAERG